MSAGVERPRVQQYGAEFSLAEGIRLMADAMGGASSLMGTLSRGIAEDPEVLDILSALAPGQIPTQIHSVVTYLLASSQDEPLARYYPCYEAEPLPASEAYPAFREFCLRRQDEVRHLLATRTMQLTFPERAARFLIALDRVEALAGEPISMVEVGCSAGLLLNFDRYRYDFGTHGVIGPEDSPVTIENELRGPAARAPSRMPNILARVGIELQPVDLTDPDEAAWILASIGAERREGRRAAEAALALARDSGLDIRAGDAVALLPEVAASLGGALCVLNSHCMYQWPAAVVEAFEQVLLELSRGRDVHHVSVEGVNRGPAHIVHRLLRGGEVVSGVKIGEADKGGRWIEIEA